MIMNIMVMLVMIMMRMKQKKKQQKKQQKKKKKYMSTFHLHNRLTCFNWSKSVDCAIIREA